MRKPYQKKQGNLVAVIEPINYGKTPRQLSPQFGHEALEENDTRFTQDEDLSYLAEDELSIEEVYQEVLNAIKAKRVNF